MPVEVRVQVRDEMFKPLDNATVRVIVTTPDDKTIELNAEASEESAGVYRIDFVTRATGAYRAKVAVSAADGSEIGERETGWTSEPATNEFRTLTPNRALLERLAQKTDGEIVSDRDLHGFVSQLPNRKIPVTEDWIYPLWHQWSVFFLAVGCLVGEWGLRRWKGLP